MEKVINKIVGFQQDTVENINWSKIWQQLKWMYSFGKGYRKRIYFLCAISCFFALLGVVYAYIYKELMDLIMQQYQVIINFLVEKIPLLQNSSFFDKVAVLAGMLPTWILWIVGAYLLYKIIAYCYSLFMKFFTLRLSLDLSQDIQRRVYATVLESDWLSLTEFRAGDLVNRVASDSGTISSFALDTVPSLVVQLVQFLAAFSMLCYLDWTLTLVAFVGVPMYLFIIKLKGKRTRAYNQRGLELGATYSSFLYESMANIMVIKSFMLVPEFIRRFRGIQREQYDLSIEQTKYGIVTGAIIGIIGRLLGIAVTVFILMRILNGHITVGVLMAFAMLRTQVSGPVTNMMSFIMSSIEISASAERVMTLFSLPRDKTQVPEEVKAFGERAKSSGMGVSLENLSFAYVGDEIVLHDVDIDVQPGETVAFVGPSGEGKTTLIRLILGLLTPREGQARLRTGNGESLELSVETREFFSYVPQGNTMFSGTIRENMLHGRPDATDEEIIDALKQACIWKFVESLPTGLDTKIGERGVGVSEGQAQRLAIARALLRKAPILLLDEATSALDIYTEKDVLDNIFNAGFCKTCILTTHRPSVFTVCDKIYRVRQRTVELIKSSREQEVQF